MSNRVEDPAKNLVAADKRLSGKLFSLPLRLNWIFMAGFYLLCMGFIVDVLFYNSYILQSAEAEMQNSMAEKIEVATFAAGCFWCVEAVFENFAGVKKVESGYAGGSTEDPTYEKVSRGTTGHAEVVQITFDANKISFRDLLVIFFHAHDPTTPNRQGADIGSEYRSILFYHDDDQHDKIKQVIKEIEAQKLWPAPIVTEVLEFKHFYPAEQYHQNYYRNNRNQPYCSIVIAPKLQKLYKQFADKLTH